MRTTVDIPDHILIEAKKLAATRKTSLASVVADSLRKYLADCRREEEEGPKEHYEIPLVESGPPVEGVDLNDTSMLWEL